MNTLFDDSIGAGTSKVQGVSGLTVGRAYCSIGLDDSWELLEFGGRWLDLETVQF
jgi:hypothetical protein